MLERLARTLVAAALAGAVVIAAGGFTLVQIGLRPVRDLSAQIQALEADTLHRLLDGSAQPDELAPLVAHVNELLKRRTKPMNNWMPSTLTLRMNCSRRWRR